MRRDVVVRNGVSFAVLLYCSTALLLYMVFRVGGRGGVDFCVAISSLFFVLWLP